MNRVGSTMSATVAKKQQENMNQKLALVIKSGKYKLGKCISAVNAVCVSRLQAIIKSIEIRTSQTHLDLQQLPLHQKN